MRIGGGDWAAGGRRARVPGTGVARGGRDLAAMEQATGGTGDKVQALPDRGCGLLGTCMRPVMRAAVGFRTCAGTRRVMMQLIYEWLQWVDAVSWV